MKKVKMLLTLLLGLVLIGCTSPIENKNTTNNNLNKNITFEKLKQNFINANFEINDGTLYTDMVNAIYVVYGDSDNNSLVAEYKTVEIAKAECDSNNEAGYSICARNGKFIILYDKNEPQIVLQTFNDSFK